MMVLSLLKAAGAVQVAVALLNLNLVKLLGWREALADMPLLVRQVFQVHLWFISITLAMFGVLTWRFAPAMHDHSDEPAVWLAGAIGVFWGVRAVMQVMYYSREHWQGRAAETAVHVTLLMVYSGLGALYLTTACGGAS